MITTKGIQPTKIVPSVIRGSFKLDLTANADKPRGGGRILGGDSGMTYVGTIQTDDDGAFSGTINAEQYLDHGDAFFPGVKSLDVRLAGKYSNGSIDGTASVSLAPNQKIKLSGNKKTNL